MFFVKGRKCAQMPNKKLKTDINQRADFCRLTGCYVRLVKDRGSSAY
jgi:hypothetical protein